MKRVLLVFFLWVTCVSCSSTTTLTIPFSADVYESSSDYLRTVSHGESENFSVAERMAIHNAQTELASLVQSLVKNVSSEFNSKFADAEWRSYFQKEEMAISQKTISKLRVVATKELINSDKRYEIWVVIEVPRKVLVENFDHFFADSKLKNGVEIKNQFQQLFNEEWNKLKD